MAVWMPVTVVPTSWATVAIATFMTEVSRVIRNWADANVRSTLADAAPAARVAVAVMAGVNRGRPAAGSPALGDARGRAPGSQLQRPRPQEEHRMSGTDGEDVDAL